RAENRGQLRAGGRLELEGVEGGRRLPPAPPGAEGGPRWGRRLALPEGIPIHRQVRGAWGREPREPRRGADGLVRASFHTVPIHAASFVFFGAGILAARPPRVSIRIEVQRLEELVPEA